MVDVENFDAIEVMAKGVRVFLIFLEHYFCAVVCVFVYVCVCVCVCACAYAYAYTYAGTVRIVCSYACACVRACACKLF